MHIRERTSVSSHFCHIPLRDLLCCRPVDLIVYRSPLHTALAVLAYLSFLIPQARNFVLCVFVEIRQDIRVAGLAALQMGRKHYFLNHRRASNPCRPRADRDGISTSTFRSTPKSNGAREKNSLRVRPWRS